MKKFSITLFFILLTVSINAQKNFYNEFLKEIIVARTLIAENRISEFSEFLNEKSYYPMQENLYIKYPLWQDDEFQDVVAGFIIQDNNDFLGIVTIKKDNEIKYELPKRDLFLIRNKLFENLNPGLSYGQFLQFKKGLENGSINADLKKEGKIMDFEIINRYKFRAGEKNKPEKWTTYEASNFSTMSSNDKFHNISFLGPGKIDWINLKFQKFSDKNFDEDVETVFLVEAIQVSDNYSQNEFLNIPYFMALKNFNDRIWHDK